MTLHCRNFLRNTPSSVATFATAVRVTTDVKWDEAYSLLIIGTGHTGLETDLESHYLGAKDILVVDKMSSPCGNSVINVGAFSAPATD